MWMILIFSKYIMHELLDFGKSYWIYDYLFKKNRLYVPDSSIHELFVREAHKDKKYGILVLPKLWLYCMNTFIGWR